jgi:two-component system NtrC family response regulator
MTKILIVDDEPMVCEILGQAVQEAGHTPVAVSRLEEGLQQADREPLEAVLLDVRLPDGNGIEYLTDFLNLWSSPEVVIITGQGDPEGAELALTKGAFDFLQKPASIQEAKLTLVRALEYRRARLEKQSRQIVRRDGIIGSSPQLEKSLQSMVDAAETESNVLIQGETGTGKELFARAIHLNSSRSEGSFVIVDCSALAENLVESMLFGHVKGAFTGAATSHEGLVAQAHNGTLFLDEVGELSLEKQKKFLRVLDEKRYRPVGSSKEHRSDFRLIAATNRNLEDMLRGERFRSDLLYRIRSHEISLPPLRERKEDIQELVHAFLSRITAEKGQKAKTIYPDFLEILSTYDWPGNVRELLNVMEQAVSAAGDEPVLHRKHLPLYLRVALAKRSFAQPAVDQPILSPNVSPLGEKQVLDWKAFRQTVLSEAEERYFQELFAYTDGNVKQMAQLAGLTQARVYEIIKKLNLSR